MPIAFGRYEGRQPLDPISSMTVVRQDLFDDYCTNGIRKPAKLTPRDNLKFPRPSIPAVGTGGNFS